MLTRLHCFGATAEDAPVFDVRFLILKAVWLGRDAGDAVLPLASAALHMICATLPKCALCTHLMVTRLYACYRYWFMPAVENLSGVLDTGIGYMTIF